MNFQERFAELHQEKVLTFLEEQKNPVFEAILLKEAFADHDSFASALELLQRHFVLFHFLFSQQNRFALENKLLHIHFMRIQLIPFPQTGKCRHYQELQGHFCKADTLPEEPLCPFHHKQVDDNGLENLSLKYYYLDEKNYFDITQEEAEAFISGAWDVIVNYQAIDQARNFLELPKGFDLAMLKRKYKILAREHHPDLHPQKDNLFREINNAYRTLLKMFP